jgi:hypothetical protein
MVTLIDIIIERREERRRTRSSLSDPFYIHLNENLITLLNNHDELLMNQQILLKQYSFTCKP